MKRRRPAPDPENASFWSRLSPATRGATLGLVRAWGGFQRWMEPHFRRYGLSQPQFTVLMTLRRSSPDGITLTELARSIFVTNTNITGLVDRLERDGRVERRRDPDDRRAQRVALTSRGRLTLERVWERHPVMLEAAFSGLAEPERRTLARLLDRLMASLARSPEIPPARRSGSRIERGRS